MKVTDEMVLKALNAFDNCEDLDYDNISYFAMKAALEAVFEHIREATKKVELDDGLERNPHPLGTSLYLRWQIDEDNKYTEKLINRKLAEMYPKEEKKEPKKQTLLQWIANKHCGKPHPLTEREQFLMGLVSRYGQYLDQRD